MFSVRLIEPTNTPFFRELTVCRRHSRYHALERGAACFMHSITRAISDRAARLLFAIRKGNLEVTRGQYRRLENQKLWHAGISAVRARSPTIKTRARVGSSRPTDQRVGNTIVCWIKNLIHSQVDHLAKAAECSCMIQRIADPDRRVVLESPRRFGSR
jgi:hypothetical protein